MGEKNRMETEPVGKLLLKMAVPTVLAQIVNLLYNIVDRMYVGRIEGIGTLALGGLGVSFPILILISAFSYLIGAGGASRAAIFMGRKENDTAERILGSCTLMTIIASAVLTVFFLVFREPILLIFGATPENLPFAMEYTQIYLYGTVFVLSALGLNMFITNQGFTKTSMATVCIGAVLNIILDPIFIFGFNMGVRGAALATIISQCVSAVWVVMFLTSKHTILKIKIKYLKLPWAVVSGVISLGISPFIMQATECLVQLVFNRGMRTYGDNNYIALMSILFSLTQMIWLPLQGISQGAQPIIGYNFGAGNKERVKSTFKILFAVNGGAFPSDISGMLYTGRKRYFNRQKRFKTFPCGNVTYGRTVSLSANLPCIGSGENQHIFGTAQKSHSPYSFGTYSAAFGFGRLGIFPCGGSKRRYRRNGYNNHV